MASLFVATIAANSGLFTIFDELLDANNDVIKLKPLTAIYSNSLGLYGDTVSSKYLIIYPSQNLFMYHHSLYVPVVTMSCANNNSLQ